MQHLSREVPGGRFQLRYAILGASFAACLGAVRSLVTSSGYKLSVVVDLLRGFVPESWVRSSAQVAAARGGQEGVDHFPLVSDIGIRTAVAPLHPSPGAARELPCRRRGRSCSTNATHSAEARVSSSTGPHGRLRDAFSGQAEPSGPPCGTVRAIDGNRLRIGPLEAIDGTPVVIEPVPLGARHIADRQGGREWKRTPHTGLISKLGHKFRSPGSPVLLLRQPPPLDLSQPQQQQVPTRAHLVQPRRP
jgi:hypothetical protein